ncbi:hypothetical protein EPO34_00870 [Patescibacteria group bacterium]|nr:MAG: hypothetical protein EPO34_00870 [Patescibacteria group bacterium]
MKFPYELEEQGKIYASVGLSNPDYIVEMTLVFSSRTYIKAITVDEEMFHDVQKERKHYDKKAKMEVVETVTVREAVTFVAEADDEAFGIRKDDHCYGIEATETAARQRIDETGTLVRLGGYVLSRVPCPTVVLLASELRMKGETYADGKPRKMLVAWKRGWSTAYAVPANLHEARARGEFQDLNPKSPPQMTLLFHGQTYGQENVPIRDAVALIPFGKVVRVKEADLHCKGVMTVFLHREMLHEIIADIVPLVKQPDASDAIEVKDAIRAGGEAFPRPALRDLLDIGHGVSDEVLARAMKNLSRYEPGKRRKEFEHRGMRVPRERLVNQYEALKALIGEIEAKLKKQKAEAAPPEAPAAAEAAAASPAVDPDLAGFDTGDGAESAPPVTEAEKPPTVH